MATLEYSTNKEKNDYIKMMKAKVTDMSNPELKDKILKSLKKKKQGCYR